MVIEVRKSRSEISDEIELSGYEFWGYMYDDRGNEYWDDEIYYNEKEGKLLWVNWMNGEWFLYKKINRKPKCTWQNDWVFLSHKKGVVLDISREAYRVIEGISNWRYIRLEKNGKVLYFEAIDGGDIDWGINI